MQIISFLNPSSFNLDIVGMIIVLMLIRLRRAVTGTRVSSVASIFYSLWYVVFVVFIVFGSYYIGVPLYLFIGYAGLAVAVTLLSFRYSARSLSFWKGVDGAIYFKGGLVVQLIYVIAFIIRVTLAYYVIGIQYIFYFGGGVAPTVLNSSMLMAIIANDLLVMLGSGLRLGRTFQAFRMSNLISNGRYELLMSKK